MNRMKRTSFNKILAILLLVAIVLTASSCSILQIRETKESESGDIETDLPETYDSVKTTEPAETVKREICLAFTGDIMLQDGVQGKCFDRVKDKLSNSDIAVGQVSGSVENLSVLEPLGLDLVDTTRYGDYGVIEKSGYNGISADYDMLQSIRIINSQNVAFAFMSLGGDGYAQSYNAPETAENVEYADFISDIVIITLHWSDETQESDRHGIIEMLAKSGADIIIADGDGVGKVEWADKGDGTSSLYVHSLGSLLSASDNADDLYGGILSFSVTVVGSRIEIEKISVLPTFVYYETDYKNLATALLSEYEDSLTDKHAIPGLHYTAMTEHFMASASAEYIQQ